MNHKPATATAFAGSLVIGTAWTVTHMAWTFAHKLAADRHPAGSHRRRTR